MFQNYGECPIPQEFRTMRGFLGNELLELTGAVRTVSTRHNLSLGMNAEGIYLAERIFGVTIVNSDGARVPLRYVGERHVKEDLGRIPTVQDWLSQISPQRWMYGQRFEDIASRT